MKSMPFFWSKINWLAVGTFVLGVVPILMDLAKAQTPGWEPIALAVVGIINFVIRTWGTSTAKLTLK